MATGPAPLPPTTIHTTKSISQSAAHDFLAAYLERANTDPALQPSAGISEHGPVSRTTAAAPNLILHNLKRVQAGLAGEVLGRDLSLSNLTGAPGSQKDPAAGDWEDAKKFEQEGEGVYEGDYDADVAGAGGAEVPMEVDTAEGGAVDKEERKKKKKERRLAEKRAKAKADADEA